MLSVELLIEKWNKSVILTDYISFYYRSYGVSMIYYNNEEV